MGKTTTEAKRQWLDKHYAQIKVSMDKALAGEFKAACAASGVSVASVVKAAAAAYCAGEGEPARAGAGRPGSSRGRRRAWVAAIVSSLEEIRDAEERYRERIPENMQGGERAEAAERSAAALDEAIDLLRDAY